MQPAFIYNFEKTIIHAIEKNNAPGLVANIVLDRELAYSKAFGVSKASVPITSDTIFSIMSISKSFTATAIMQLVEKRVILLDDPVSNYLPYFHIHDEKYKKNPITVKQLLSHTAGFPEYFPIASFQDHNLVNMFRGVPKYNALLENFSEELLGKIKTREDVTRYFAHVKLQYDPGEGWQYCTDAYVIAGDLLEKVSGMTWEEYLHKNIFSNLKLSKTFTDPARLKEEENVTHYYTLIGSELSEMPTPINPICAPAGFIYSTANDMTKYLIAHMDYDDSPLISKESLETMQDMIAVREENVSYGLGWRIRKFHNNKIVEHAGGYPGMAAYVTMIPKKGFAVILFSNCDKVPVKYLSELVTEEYVESLN
ncbi:serine hydrolase [Paenibacillus sp. 32O-W]|uniref:serine hydrolase domain-containing protein n=1 Tax=Paenibacillus sp. 32O-W TaxID=1695218 RepID=UPI000721297D|nr:serine hydrolase domain-containing protein [Paenibacillus sp. 32O-W]ALS25604.1 serine hydrolase [Paenibacillus sp. 32O-W]